MKHIITFFSDPRKVQLLLLVLTLALFVFAAGAPTATGGTGG
ncbi:MAG TPA: hypothetical protein VN376_08955 [Longilinea sp.]|jgi:hypothetical protein|nr:hypothetical protein [Longilinea sp.]